MNWATFDIINTKMKKKKTTIEQIKLSSQDIFIILAFVWL